MHLYDIAIHWGTSTGNKNTNLCYKQSKSPLYRLAWSSVCVWGRYFLSQIKCVILHGYKGQRTLKLPKNSNEEETAKITKGKGKGGVYVWYKSKLILRVLNYYYYLLDHWKPPQYYIKVNSYSSGHRTVKSGKLQKWRKVMVKVGFSFGINRSL